jgi:hypothetical protein
VPVPSPIEPTETRRGTWANEAASDSSHVPPIATAVSIHDILPHDPADSGRMQPWRVGRWVGMGGAIVFGGAALLLLCAVHGYRQITEAANAAVKPPVAFPRPGVLVIPPPPARPRPVAFARVPEAPRPPEPPPPAPIIIGAGN